jgi:hypothetical protein
VQCFVCGGFMFNWTDGAPLDEHLKWLTDCQFANIKQQFPEQLIEVCTMIIYILKVYICVLWCNGYPNPIHVFRA